MLRILQHIIIESKRRMESFALKKEVVVEEVEVEVEVEEEEELNLHAETSGKMFAGDGEDLSVDVDVGLIDAKRHAGYADKNYLIVIS